MRSANHKYKRLLIVQYFPLPNSLFNNKTTEQEPTSLKMKLTSTLTRMEYVNRFCSVDVCQQSKSASA